MTTYPTQPTGDNIVDLTNIFASNNTSKITMSTAEILDGYNNDGEPATPLTSTPDGNKFNYFWYQVHNTVSWLVNYVKALYDNKLELTGGTMSGVIAMGSNKITGLSDGTANNDAVNKGQLDAAINGAMWLGEIKYLSYPSIPTLPSGVEIVNADGRALSRTTYATLFSILGTTFGAGDNSTTFNIPNLLGKYAVGWDSVGAVDSGRSFGSDQKRENSKFLKKVDLANGSSKTLNISNYASTDGYIYVTSRFNASVQIRNDESSSWTQIYYRNYSDQGFYNNDFIRIPKGTYYLVTATSGTLTFYPEVTSILNSTATQTNIALYPVIRIK